MDVETVRFVKTFDKQSVLSVKYEEKKYLSVVLLGSFFLCGNIFFLVNIKGTQIQIYMHCKMFFEAFDHANEQNVGMRSIKATGRK